jgi:hypothetical protein
MSFWLEEASSGTDSRFHNPDSNHALTNLFVFLTGKDSRALVGILSGFRAVKFGTGLARVVTSRWPRTAKSTSVEAHKIYRSLPKEALTRLKMNKGRVSFETERANVETTVITNSFIGLEFMLQVVKICSFLYR